MEDKRTALAILLIIVVVMLYSELFITPKYRPRPSNQTAAPTAQSQATASAPQSPAPVQTTPQRPTPSITAPATSSTSSSPTLRVPSAQELAQSPRLKVTTGKFELSLVLLGGRIESFKLASYLSHAQGPDLLEMVKTTEGSPLPLGIYRGDFSDALVQYVIDESLPPTEPLRVESGTQKDLILRGTFPDGSTIRKKLSFSGDSYLIGIEASTEGATAGGSSLWLEWTAYLSEQEIHGSLDPWTYTLLTDGSKIVHTALSEVPRTLSNPTPVKWVAIADKYFTSTLIPSEAGPNARIGRTEENFAQRVKGQPSHVAATIFVGPKDYRILESLGSDLERSIDLGFFSFLAYPLLVLIRVFHSIFGNYGVAIVALTLLIKGLFFPLTKASLRSMQKMQELQPEMKALRERIKDPTQLNQEMLSLYKKKGVNPIGGCFPIMIQIPVFFGLYSALLHSIELRHAPFAVWITDLSSPERLELAGINIPVMILLMGAAMFYQQYTAPMPSVDPAQRKMMLWMSAIFPVTFLIFPFPSGLALYMLTNTAISLVQQAYLKNDKKANPFWATALASIAIFFLAYVLTLL